jgi:hypothetical protein
MQYVCTDRDFDMQTRTAVLQPRVCQIVVRLYVHCMVVVARTYYTIVLMERTTFSVYLYGRCSAIILYTVFVLTHARRAVHATRDGLAPARAPAPAATRERGLAPLRHARRAERGALTLLPKHPSALPLSVDAPAR